jgi:cysteinyl-tRNA synthetase
LQRLATEINKAKSAGDKATAVKHAAELLSLGRILGLLQLAPADFLQKPKLPAPAAEGSTQQREQKALPAAEIERMIEDRREARRSKNFRRADEIRNELANAGIVLEDKPDGSTEWRRS